MQNEINEMDKVEAAFLSSCFDVKLHLADYLEKNLEEVEALLPKASAKLASLHLGSLDFSDVTSFYEKTVGYSHLFELAAWHLTSRDYIADTLRLQYMYANGHLLDFGGGIGTHSLAAAQITSVEHVWFVDLNPYNRDFVKRRSEILGLDKRISVHRDLESINEVLDFDTLICLDVLEHLPDPSGQLIKFHKRLKPNSRLKFIRD